MNGTIAIGQLSIDEQENAANIYDLLRTVNGTIAIDQFKFSIDEQENAANYHLYTTY